MCIHSPSKIEKLDGPVTSYKVIDVDEFGTKLPIFRVARSYWTNRSPYYLELNGGTRYNPDKYFHAFEELERAKEFLSYLRKVDNNPCCYTLSNYITNLQLWETTQSGTIYRGPWEIDDSPIIASTKIEFIKEVTVC